MGKQTAAPSAAKIRVTIPPALRSREAFAAAFFDGLTPDEVDAAVEDYESLPDDVRQRYADRTPADCLADPAFRRHVGAARVNRAPRAARQPIVVARPRERRERHVARSTSGGDPGSDSDSDPARRCAACGADLSHRRAGAKTCDALCRKRLSRGAITAPRPAAPVRSRRLIDEIDERARERHLAWSTPRPDRALIGDLDAALEGLYAELRRRRATQPLSIGHSASVVAHAPPLARPWPSTQGAHRTRELEVVT